jgi:hypothetical protein
MSEPPSNQEIEPQQTAPTSGQLQQAPSAYSALTTRRSPWLIIAGVVGAIVVAALLVALLVVPRLPSSGTGASTTHVAPTATSASSGGLQPTATVGESTAVAISAPTQPTALPTFLVNPTDTVEYCAVGQWPNAITVGNTGSSSLTWSATAPQGVTLTPASGTLSAGSSNSPTIQQVQISGKSTQAQLTLSFTSSSGNATVNITCASL